MTTLLVPPETLDREVVVIEGEAFRHLFRARRLEVGERLRVADGVGRARWARVAKVERRRALAVPGAEAPANEPGVRVELLVATLRPQRAVWLVEKCTEIGVAAVRFVRCERAPRSFGRASFERFRRVARAAVEQAERARVPEVTGVHPWAEIDGLIAGFERRWVLDPGGPASDPSRRARAETVVLVGPEGGWSDGERRHLAELGCGRMGLGPTVLRVETAAVVGAALAMVR